MDHFKGFTNYLIILNEKLLFMGWTGYWSSRILIQMHTTRLLLSYL